MGEVHAFFLSYSHSFPPFHSHYRQTGMGLGMGPGPAPHSDEPRAVVDGLTNQRLSTRAPTLSMPYLLGQAEDNRNRKVGAYPRKVSIQSKAVKPTLWVPPLIVLSWGRVLLRSFLFGLERWSVGVHGQHTERHN